MEKQHKKPRLCAAAVRGGAECAWGNASENKFVARCTLHKGLFVPRLAKEEAVNTLSSAGGSGDTREG